MTEDELRKAIRGNLYPRLGGSWTQEQEDETVDALLSLYRDNERAAHVCVDCGKSLVRCENCERLWQT